MRVLCLTFGDHTQGSTYFRVHQYIAPLARLGINLEPVAARQFKDWDHLSAYDAVLLQKALLPLSKLRRLRRLARRLIYDVDDAIWHPHGRPHFFLTNLRRNFRLRAAARSADLCTTANEVLANHLRRWSSRVAVVPMSLDQQQWRTHHASADPNPIRIGWSGNPVNFRYLQVIEPALVEVQSKFPRAEFTIFSGTPLNFARLRTIHLPFVFGQEAEVIRTFDIGLLPLPDDAFAQGKSPIKGLQYIASGSAVVASPIGATREMFFEKGTAIWARSNAEWSEALATLILDPGLRQQTSQKARRLFETNYSTEQIAMRLAQLLRPTHAMEEA